MSEFYVGRYQEISSGRRICEVLGWSGARINHLYDWGSSTELPISFAGVAEAVYTKPTVVTRNGARSTSELANIKESPRIRRLPALLLTLNEKEPSLNEKEKSLRIVFWSRTTKNLFYSPLP
jgi:hypothetical protein